MRPITADKKTSYYYKLPVRKKHTKYQLFREIKRQDCLHFLLHRKTKRMRIFSFISSKLEIYLVKWEIPFSPQVKNDLNMFAAPIH